MARKPNYQFERMERDRQKAAKQAAKAAAKRADAEREASGGTAAPAQDGAGED
ncbi:MAG: hypothetical protein ABI655_16065 [Phenylobacterium sp.]